MSSLMQVLAKTLRKFLEYCVTEKQRDLKNRNAEALLSPSDVLLFLGENACLFERIT